jgi:hypothetical protein
VKGSRQNVTVETRKANHAIVGARCDLSNDKGNYSVVTPGSVTIRRSHSNLSISCTKAGELPGATVVESRTTDSVVESMLLGSVVGAGIDRASGSAYDYPSIITVHMGKNLMNSHPPILHVNPFKKTQ